MAGLERAGRSVIIGRRRRLALCGLSALRVGCAVPRFQTTLKRGLARLPVGILLCSLILVLVVVASAALGRSGNIDWAWVAEELSGLALPGSAIVAGICLVGAVLWLPFHALGWRHWSLAALVGGELFWCNRSFGSGRHVADGVSHRATELGTSVIGELLHCE